MDLEVIKILLLISRLRGRATLRLEKGARLMGQARIRNGGNNSDDISVGAGSIIRGELLRFAHGGNINIGKNCYVGEGSRIWSGSRISIGNNVLISHNVFILDNLTHSLDWRERRLHFAAISSIGHPSDISLEDLPVRIGDDAWVGAHAIILRGVSVGERAIIAAGAVVTKDVAPDTIVAGNPARFIRTLPNTKT
jgi:acetyltransferase-like isoleucine patch superfamily enzyme